MLASRGLASGTSILLLEDGCQACTIGTSSMPVVQDRDLFSARIFHSRLNFCAAGAAVSFPNLALNSSSAIISRSRRSTSPSNSVLGRSSAATRSSSMIPPLGISTDWDRHFLTGSDVSDFIARIDAGKTRALADPVQLVAAIGAVPGRKPWGPAIKALLRGVRFLIADGEEPLFQRVLIERCDMLRLCGLRFDYAAWPDRFSTEVVLGDALEIMNLAWKYKAVVLSKPVNGIVPRRVAIDDVLDLADLYVSTAELVARTSRSPLGIGNFLRKAGLFQPFPGCWFRLPAERQLILADSDVSGTIIGRRKKA